MPLINKEYYQKQIADRMKEQMEEIAIYEILAKSDDAAKMIEELKALG